MRERYDFTALSKPQEPNDEDHLFGPQAGVRLPNTSATVPRGLAGALYADTTIRSRLRCRYACCAGKLEGPAVDPRRHYLHSRAAETTELLDSPIAWRAQTEWRRVDRAIDLVDMINDGHIPAGSHPLKTRTLVALREILDSPTRAQSAS
jgi:hypothetical protein